MDSAFARSEIQPVPQAPYFDPKREAWILSRYADVLAAMHESQLWLVGPNSAGVPAADARAAQSQLRNDTQSALPATRVAVWKSEAEARAHAMIATLPVATSIEVVGEFARPWSLALAISVSRANSADAKRLAALAERVSVATACPENSALKAESIAANAELDQAFANAPQPMASPAFVALSQTVPAFLANAWLILLRHPQELRLLRADANLLPRAVEELLRLVSLASVLHRRAITDTKLGELRIKAGERVDLNVAIANHDPEQFPDPHRFDPQRRAQGHFALGAGQHSCVGASLIRMAITVATTAFVENFDPTGTITPLEWRGGSSFRWPAAVYALRVG